MNGLSSKLKLFPLAENRILYLVFEGEEFGYAKGPVAPDEYPKEPLIVFYPGRHFYIELEAHLEDLDCFSAQQKVTIQNSIRFLATISGQSIKEHWWHQLDNDLQTWLLEYVIWRNGKPLPEWFGPRPECCQTATTLMGKTSDHSRPYPYIYLSQRYSASKDCYVGEALWWSGSVVITNCPFCGSELPQVITDNEAVGPIHQPNDGYCGSCNQRSHVCECRPPSAAFKVKNG